MISFKEFLTESYKMKMVHSRGTLENSTKIGPHKVHIVSAPRGSYRSFDFEVDGDSHHDGTVDDNHANSIGLHVYNVFKDHLINDKPNAVSFSAYNKNRHDVKFGKLAEKIAKSTGYKYSKIGDKHLLTKVKE